jgi:hypothetical protein
MNSDLKEVLTLSPSTREKRKSNKTTIENIQRSLNIIDGQKQIDEYNQYSKKRKKGNPIKSQRKIILTTQTVIKTYLIENSDPETAPPTSNPQVVSEVDPIPQKKDEVEETDEITLIESPRKKKKVESMKQLTFKEIYKRGNERVIVKIDE